MSEPSHTNRLADQTSPYLLQHAHNPVDWYPWGEEALKKSQMEDKPILLSIGYCACHWCHVMEHESFENEQIAALMNKYFVNIKVDREERPDLDNIYQTSIQLFGQNGGWPLTIFLTPDREPFYGGTYYPPENRHGQPGFPNVLLSVIKFYRDDKEKMNESIQKIRDALEQINRTRKVREAELSVDLLEGAVEKLKSIFDTVHGGFGSQPKFPNTLNLSLFMRMGRRTGRSEYIDMALLALRRMAEGGIYDQIGGGYHRYSVDEKWLVPHFEKMLYDNALIVRVNVEGFQLSKDPLLEKVTRQTLDFVLRKMTHPKGGFYSTLDADSEGAEGTFYVWNEKEVQDVLGEKHGKILCNYYGITSEGNFEGGTSVLSLCSTPERLSAEFQLSQDKISHIIQDGADQLLKARLNRPAPFRDEKIITGWNGLMISAFVGAAQVLNEDKYKTAACQATDFILEHLVQNTNIYRSIKDGKSGTFGYLDDYAFFTAALLDVYELTQDRKYLDHAVAFADDTLQQFWDERKGGFYFTRRDHERLIQRPKAAQDQSIPSGTSVSVLNLLRLFTLTERVDFREPAVQVLRIYRKDIEENPFGFANLLCALDAFLEGLREIVVVGDPEDESTQDILEKINQIYLPNKVVINLTPDQELSENVPEFMKEKTQVEGKPTVYICQNYACSSPVTVWEQIESILTEPVS